MESNQAFKEIVTGSLDIITASDSISPLDSRKTSNSTSVTIIKRSYKNGKLKVKEADGKEADTDKEVKAVDKEVKDADKEEPPAEVPNDAGTHALSEMHSQLSCSQSSISKDSITLTDEQKEELIEKLETKKFNLKREYQEGSDPGVKSEYREVSELLSKLKESNAVEKVQINIEDIDKVSSQFRQKTKELAITDFNRIIDLTGSKESRKPDIATETWHRSKTVVFKDKVYRPPPEEKREKFLSKMQLKPMPSELKRSLDKKIDGTLTVLKMQEMNSDVKRYKKYDPFNYHGLTEY